MFDYLIIGLGMASMLILGMAILGFSASAYLKYRGSFLAACLFYLWLKLRRGKTKHTLDDIDRLRAMAIAEYKKHHTPKEDGDALP